MSISETFLTSREDEATQDRAEAMLREDMSLATDVLFQVNSPQALSLSYEYEARGRKYHAYLVRPGSSSSPEIRWETPSPLGPEVLPVVHRLTVPSYGHVVHETYDPSHQGLTQRLARIKGRPQGPKFRREDLSPYQLLAIASDFNQERFSIASLRQAPPNT